ncbi:MAG: ubiquinol-cytochrome C chaperone family protein [Hyphomicrobium sp.]
MFAWLKARASHRTRAAEIYGAVVTAARNPRYYSDFSVPDTPEGRFEMVALMQFLVLERVKRVMPGGMDLAQGAIEAFVTDMDDCLREMGVGDLTVPKKVKRAAAAFYERAGMYRAGLAEGARGEQGQSCEIDGSLAGALGNAIYGNENSAAASGLACLVARQATALAAADDETVLNGKALVALLDGAAA